MISQLIKLTLLESVGFVDTLMPGFILNHSHYIIMLTKF